MLAKREFEFTSSMPRSASPAARLCRRPRRCCLSLAPEVDVQAPHRAASSISSTTGPICATFLLVAASPSCVFFFSDFESPSPRVAPRAALASSNRHRILIPADSQDFANLPCYRLRRRLSPPSQRAKCVPLCVGRAGRSIYSLTLRRASCSPHASAMMLVGRRPVAFGWKRPPADLSLPPRLPLIKPPRAMRSRHATAEAALRPLSLCHSRLRLS